MIADQSLPDQRQHQVRSADVVSVEIGVQLISAVQFSFILDDLRDSECNPDIVHQHPAEQSRRSAVEMEIGWIQVIHNILMKSFDPVEQRRQPYRIMLSHNLDGQFELDDIGTTIKQFKQTVQKTLNWILRGFGDLRVIFLILQHAVLVFPILVDSSNVYVGRGEIVREESTHLITQIFMESEEILSEGEGIWVDSGLHLRYDQLC